MPDQTITESQAREVLRHIAEAGGTKDDIEAATARMGTIVPDTDSRTGAEKFWSDHPTVAGVVRGATSTLPYLGGTLGALAGAELGPGAVLPMAGGAAIGRGVQNQLDEKMGLKPEAGLMSQAADMGKAGAETWLGGKAMDVLANGVVNGPAAAARQVAQPVLRVVRPVARAVGTGLEQVVSHPGFTTTAAALELARGDLKGAATAAGLAAASPAIRATGQALREWGTPPVPAEVVPPPRPTAPIPRLGPLRGPDDFTPAEAPKPAAPKPPPLGTLRNGEGVPVAKTGATAPAPPVTRVGPSARELVEQHLGIRLGPGAGEPIDKGSIWKPGMGPSAQSPAAAERVPAAPAMATKSAARPAIYNEVDAQVYAEAKVAGLSDEAAADAVMKARASRHMTHYENAVSDKKYRLNREGGK